MFTFEEKLVQAVKAKREAEGLSIRALSAAVGVSFSTLARIERGEGQPDNNSKIRLLQWLGQDADNAGLGFDNVAFVHFRAGKNVRSSTVQTLLRAADRVRLSMAGSAKWKSQDTPDDNASAVSVSKEELERTAEKFRRDLGLLDNEPLDSLRVQVEGIHVISIKTADFLETSIKSQLGGVASNEWSAMSVPLDSESDKWAVLLNDGHSLERQRVTVLEEFWHILLGHKLTKIARVAEAYGRTYDKTEEHDAYYLASATLLPRISVLECVNERLSSDEIAQKFGTSSDLVDYRIKRLGLWREHSGKQIKLTPE